MPKNVDRIGIGKRFGIAVAGIAITRGVTVRGRTAAA